MAFTFGAGSTPAFGGQQQQTPATPGFGAQSTGFGFQQPQQQQQPSAFGGFGTSQAPAFGGFGTSQPPAFGASSQPQQQQQQQPTAFGGFGTSQPQQQPQPTGFAGFGTSQPTSFGGFNLTSQPQGAQTQPNLFGATTTTKPAFGTGTGPSLFGGPSTAGPLFGQSTSTPTPFGQTNVPAPMSFGQQPQQPQAINDMSQQMAAAWNPQDPRCQFKHYFYNIVHPSEVQNYGPAPTDDPTLYAQAQRDNPDPKCMVPVLAVGFGDIKKRLEIQDQAYQAHKAKLEEIRTQIESLQRKHYLDTLTKLEEYKRRQGVLVAKTVHLMKSVQLTRNRSYSIRAEEEKFKSRLEAMERELQKPSVFRGRLNEIWACLQQMKRMKEFGVTGALDVEWGVGDEVQAGLVYQTLAGHQKGLSVLMEVVKEDNKVGDEMLRGYDEAGFHRR